jgi:hypothetical protein
MVRRAAVIRHGSADDPDADAIVRGRTDQLSRRRARQARPERRFFRAGSRSAAAARRWRDASFAASRVPYTYAAETASIPNEEPS